MYECKQNSISYLLFTIGVLVYENILLHYFSIFNSLWEMAGKGMDGVQSTLLTSFVQEIDFGWFFFPLQVDWLLYRCYVPYKISRWYFYNNILVLHTKKIYPTNNGPSLVDPEIFSIK